MEFGIAIPTDADSWRVVQRAEELGFTHAWFYDTQMLSADCFVAMAAAAMKTTRIRLGTGVLIPSNRIAAVTANAFATLNKLAPGRIDFGVGTGLHRPARDGPRRDEARRTWRNISASCTRCWAARRSRPRSRAPRRKIRLLNPELGLINTDDPIALHVAASGPRRAALTARLGAGWINFIADVAGGDRRARRDAAAWTAAGHAATARRGRLGLRLRAGGGRAADQPRAMAQAGPRAACCCTAPRTRRCRPAEHLDDPPKASPRRWRAMSSWRASFEPTDARYLENHRGHLMFVKPEERPFVTAELIRRPLHRDRGRAERTGSPRCATPATPSSRCSSSRARKPRSRIGAASCGPSADGAVRCHVVRL